MMRIVKDGETTPPIESVAVSPPDPHAESSPVVSNLQTAPVGPTRTYWKYAFLSVVLFLIFSAAGFFVLLLCASAKLNAVFADKEQIGLATWMQAAHLQLAGESEGRTNIMVYGLTADGLRTDTMLLLSYYWPQHKLVALNIPRDLYVSHEGYAGKIVSLYEVAKIAKPSDRSYPAQYVSDFISKEYNLPIHYWVVVNMNAFKQTVDSLGGITVDVQRSFTDDAYPTDDYKGYMRPAPHFDAGIQTMDGNRALIYARSRHSADQPLEGTDFARSKRQELVIHAIMTKMNGGGLIYLLFKLPSDVQFLNNGVFTDFTPSEIIRLGFVLHTLSFSQDYLMANWSNNVGFLCDSSAPSTGYILLYGVPKDCSLPAGNNVSPYKEKAIEYVQNLLQHGRL